MEAFAEWLPRIGYSIEQGPVLSDLDSPARIWRVISRLTQQAMEFRLVNLHG